MGMAASQARFLGLTAKKTNIEYEGQQVNQQRMALGSQTASYYTQLLGMGVPVPPSVDQFTKMIYSWKPIGGQTNSISQMIPVTGEAGKYWVKYSYEKNVIAAEEKGVAVIDSGAGTANGSKYADVTSGTGTDIDKEEYRAVQKLIWMSKPANAGKPDTDFDTWYGAIGNHVPLVKYTVETKVGSKNIYLQKGELGLGTAMQYQVGEITQTKEETKKASFKFDEAGRPITIQPDGATEEMALSASTFKDEVAYDAAMNKYEMEKYKYQKNMDDVNSKIKIMQEQDRSLELRLKQLDTEQKAVSTEMEAVSKIIQKNVESTFKTFG